MININNPWHQKRVEPIKRRKGSVVPQWIVHRFPIKDGISIRDAWLRDLNRPTPLYQLVVKK